MKESEILNLIEQQLKDFYCLDSNTIFRRGEPITDVKITNNSNNSNNSNNIKITFCFKTKIVDLIKDGHIQDKLNKLGYTKKTDSTTKNNSNIIFSRQGMENVTITVKTFKISFFTNSDENIIRETLCIIFKKVVDYYNEDTEIKKDEQNKLTGVELEQQKELEELNKKIKKILTLKDKGDFSHELNSVKKTKRGSFILPEKYEDEIFHYLIGTYKEELCRYTTMSSLIRIIENKKNSVCSIVCMNDKSECYYAEEYIYEYEKHKHIKLDDARTEELNKYFIMSCTPIEDFDRLTMWRMYADDAKGVCIKMKIDEKIINNQDPAKKTEFYLAKVSYGDEYGNHKELDCIKELEKLNILLQKKSIWYHFFKPYDYKDENEVRLLCKCEDIDKYKWITVNSILCPVVEFNIEESNNEFPLIIESVLLGPKSPAKEINAKQLQYRIKNQNIEKADSSKPISVETSKIDHYR